VNVEEQIIGNSLVRLGLLRKRISLIEDATEGVNMMISLYMHEGGDYNLEDLHDDCKLSNRF
jgi:hypothetical protein